MAKQFGTTNIPDWQQYNTNSVIANVQYATPFGSGTPNAVASLVCDSQPQIPTAGVRIMNPSPVGFLAYLQRADGEPLTVEEAKKLNWRVSYIAFGPKS